MGISSRFGVLIGLLCIYIYIYIYAYRRGSGFGVVVQDLLSQGKPVRNPI